MSEVILVCRDCKCVFSIINPSLDLIEWPVCPSCRRSDLDDSQENS